jgi:hypothetical protein
MSLPQWGVWSSSNPQRYAAFDPRRHQLSRIAQTEECLRWYGAVPEHKGQGAANGRNERSLSISKLRHAVCMPFWWTSRP